MKSLHCNEHAEQQVRRAQLEELLKSENMQYEAELHSRGLTLYSDRL